MDVFFLYLLGGAFVGIASGFLGIGGGLLVIPFLVTVYHLLAFPQVLIMHMAVGSSLAIAIATTASSTRAHYKRKAIEWSVWKYLIPGIIIGTVLGANIADLLPGYILQAFFALFTFFMAFRLWYKNHSTGSHDLPAPHWISLAGSGIGFLCGMLGVSGGALNTPFLMRHRIPIQKAMATSAACAFPISVTGALSFMFTGWSKQALLPTYSTGYVYWPAVLGMAVTTVLFAPVGAGLTHKIQSEHLKRIFAIFLVLVGLKMLLSLPLLQQWF